MDEHYLNLFKDFVLDFHGIMFWAKKETSKGLKLKLFPILILFLIIIPGVVFAGQYKVVRVVDGDTIVIRYNGTYGVIMSQQKHRNPESKWGQHGKKIKTRGNHI
jgi:endonuclease YncB( thermonuclease family)